MTSAWEHTTVGSVCQIANGGTPKTGVESYWGGSHPWITPAEMGDLLSPYVSETRRTLTDEGMANSSARLLRPNSVILSSRAPIGHLVINTVPMATNQGCKGLAPSDRLNAKFLYYYLRSIVGLLNDLGTGTTFKELSGGRLAQVPIRIPSIAEQQRIVAILDQAFEAIDTAKANAEKNVGNGKELFENYLTDLLLRRSKAWRDEPLSDICVVERGSSPRPIKKYFTTEREGVNWIKIGDTEEGGKYVSSTEQKITPEGAQQSRYVRPGDLILTNSMSYGRPYIMATHGYIHDGWFVLRPNDDIDTEYFYYLLSSRHVQAQFGRLASGSVVKNISGDLVKQAVMPIPPVSEQRQIVEKLRRMETEEEHLGSIYAQRLSNLSALKGAILDHAFSGQL